MIMKPKHKLLILTGSLGEGHKMASAALMEAARLANPDAEAVVVDFMEWTHPRLHEFGRYCYTQWVTKFPSVYGYLFRKTRDDNTLSSLFKKLKFYTLGRIAELLREVDPSVVVCTFPGAAAAMSMMKAGGFTDVPTVTVITDFTDHSYWIHPFTDRYLVGSEHIRQSLRLRHVPDALIAVTGIPVKPQFGGPFDRRALREKHGLDQGLPTVLVMGGGLGMISKEFTAMLAGNDIIRKVQFVIVCGRNEKLRRQLDAELRHSRHGIRLTGFVGHIHELMSLSDLIITKPGGLTVSEAMASGLPLLLYKPLPGQEQDNAAYLVRSGVALEAKTCGDLASLLTDLLQEPERLARLKANTGMHNRKNAAFEALDVILQTGAAAPAPGWSRPAFA